METKKITLTTTPYTDGRIEIVTDICGEITRDVLNTKERHIREALIQLGWVPPKT